MELLGDVEAEAVRLDEALQMTISTFQAFYDLGVDLMVMMF